MIAGTIKSARVCAVWLMLTYAGALQADDLGGGVTRRPITVSDAIGMVHWTGHGDDGRSAKSDLLQLSPNGRKGLVVLKSSDLKNNLQNYSIYLFSDSEPTKPKLLVTMSSSSNREGVKAIHWLPSGESFLFLGENAGEVTEIHEYSLEDGRVQKLTQSANSVLSFDVSGDGETLVFVAEASPPDDPFEAPGVREHGVDISDIAFWENYLFGTGAYESAGSQLFVQRLGQDAVQISMREHPTDDGSISISPDARYAVVSAYAASVQSWWQQYELKDTCQSMLNNLLKSGSGTQWDFQHYWIVDLRSASAGLLIDAPRCGSSGEVTWASDAASLYVGNVFLPLDVENREAHLPRRSQTHDVKISLPGKALEVMSSEDFRRMAKSPEKTKSPLHVSLLENANNPPKIVVHNSKNGGDVVAMDLNPQFDALAFGRVETLKIHSDLGYDFSAGLYLPPDYKPGQRYPLVIQTHGYKPDEFSMDGRSEWSTAFSARPLAAEGILVLQLYAHQPGPDGRELENKALIRKFGTATTARPFKPIWRMAVTAALRDLDRRGLVDRDRVGISGFSRTVCAVSDVLTHLDLKFSAAVLVDGIDCGYFQYISYPSNAWDIDVINGGQPPFGPGLRRWIKESPSFSLDKVNTPVRLVGLGRFNAYEMWGWFSAMRLMHRPVDFTILPEASHILEKPWERRASMQSYVDWFRFWLQSYEDPAPEKAGQYRNWESLCDMQASQHPDRPAFCVRTKA